MYFLFQMRFTIMNFQDRIQIFGNRVELIQRNYVFLWFTSEEN